MRALTLLGRLFMACLLLSMGLAQASSIDIPKEPLVWVDTPNEQAGLPAKDFAFELQLFNLKDSTTGQIRFEVTEANHQDTSGLSIPAVTIQTSDAQATVTATPRLLKEGWYTVAVLTEAAQFERRNTMHILFVNGQVFYDWEGADLINSIVRHNLQSNAEYKQLQAQAREAKAIRSKTVPVNAEAEPAERFLSANEQNALNALKQSEKQRLLQDIRQLTGLENISKAGASTPAAGERVTVTVQWPTDATQATFLPLHGAPIEIINIDEIGLFDDGVFAKGVLDANGQFTFTSPVNNLKYRVKIGATHSSFKVLVSDQNDGDAPLVVQYDQAATIDIRTDITNGISAPFANSWAAFQAMYDMASNAQGFTGMAAPQLDFVLTNALSRDGGAPTIDFAYYTSPNMEWLGIPIPWTSVPQIVLGGGNFFDWDVFSHEYGHAVADQNNSIISVGGPHNGENQYDYASNTATFHNKQKANRLAMNEAYGTWFGVAFWQYSSYKGKIPLVGDTKYRDVTSTNAVFEYDLEDNAGAVFSYTNMFGEDSEIGVGRLLWDLTDAVNEDNVRATCSKYCKDAITVPMAGLMSQTIAGKQLDGISDFHREFYRYYVGKPIGDLDSVGQIDSAALKKAIQVGSVFAEFGIAANINQTNNSDPFKDIGNPALRNLDTQPVELVWEQHKTGTMPGLDQFEILFYNQAMDTLVYKTDTITLSPTGKRYTYQMPKAQAEALVQAATQLPYQAEHTLVVMIKGTATGVGAAGISTGPYYSNAEEFKLATDQRYSVIAVDSSGSNLNTDPNRLRVSAGNAMLGNMAARNDRIRTGNETGKLMSVAAIDFDSNVRVISHFADPNGLNFNSIDSYGGTEIGLAINHSVAMIQGVRPTPNPLPAIDANTPRIYALTDMEDAGSDVVPAIQNAGQNNIVFNLGHLVPLSIKKAPVGRAGEGIALKVAEPMDNIIAATLATGGSYATLENAESQEAWVALMDEINNTAPAERTTINLPLNIKLYGLAQDTGLPEPTYVFTAVDHGTVAVTVDGKGNFIPALTVDGAAGQEDIGQDQYQREFSVAKGQSYSIKINEADTAAGLYSIVLRQTSITQTPPVVVPAAAVPVPSLNVWALALLAALLGMVAMQTRRRF
ncbi:vWA domain-containing protein [Lampropedia aestuarii]|nr:vWA domain-containing protein [Lampropedia aestuarii]MDH5858520.1 VWA domain-containing protein [Lampropedia aestuarii]